MARLVIYDKENKNFKKVFLNHDTDLNQILELASSYLEIKSAELTDMYLKLSELGLSMLIDLGYMPSEDEDEENYTFNDQYEVNIIPFSDVDPMNVTQIKFATTEFDEEEMEGILELKEIRSIYEKDEKFRKLINQIQVVDADWSILISYLTSTYSFKFIFIYYNNEEES